MSHFTVLVVTKSPDELENALAPYDESIEVKPYLNKTYESPKDHWAFKSLLEEKLVPEDPTPQQFLDAWRAKYPEEVESEDLRVEDGKLTEYTRYNPSSKWDWYAIGGRWRGFLRLKPGVRNPPELIGLGDPGVPELVSGLENYDAEQVDQAYKRDVDFEAMRALAGAKAEATYDAFEKVTKVTKDLPIPRSWKDIRESYAHEEINKAREEYNSQPFIQALQKSSLLGLFSDPHKDYLIGQENARERFVSRARNAACVTYAMVKDGQWIQQGEMGWFGMAHNEMDEDEWNEQFNRALDELPDDAVLTVVDCHI